jgi:hypothetical protein
VPAKPNCCAAVVLLHASALECYTALQAASPCSVSCEAFHSWSNRLGNVKPVKSRPGLRIAARITPAAQRQCFDILSIAIYVQVALQTKNHSVASPSREFLFL